MLFVAGPAIAQSVEVRTYEVGKFLMEHGKFYLYPSKAISKKKGLEQKYAMSCNGIGEKISSQEAVGADGNLWEVEDAGDGYYYIKNNKGCYIPDDEGLDACVGKGKGKALKAKLIRNAQGKFKGVMFQKINNLYGKESRRWLNNLYGKNTDYSCIDSPNSAYNSQDDSYLSDPNYTFYFVTLDGKTIDDVSENVSYHFKYDTPDDWGEFDEHYGDLERGKLPHESPFDAVDVALDTRTLVTKRKYGDKTNMLSRLIDAMIGVCSQKNRAASNRPWSIIR